jgi:hypothetical protein
MFGYRELLGPLPYRREAGGAVWKLSCTCGEPPKQAPDEGEEGCDVSFWDSSPPKKTRATELPLLRRQLRLRIEEARP